ncbi:MAG: dependent oxidoreductase [Nevskia sp.]|nr:dependent oxidoreductase [Nevskia sp.]
MNDRNAKLDAVIIGGGHNGLVCAWYLAQRGLRVRVLERRGLVGGAAVTEEFHPGFRNSVASYTVSLLHPQIIHDMALSERGLRVVERPISNFLPLDDARYLKLGGGLERTQAEFRKFSTRDAERLPDYYAALERIAEVMRALAVEMPPHFDGSLRDLLRLARHAWKLRGLDLGGKQDLLNLFSQSARIFLDGWFESAPVQAAFGFDSIVGNFASPDHPGSAYVLLHHVFGEVNGKKGAWGHAIGGMGAITQAMQRACVDAGVDIRVNAPVRRVQVEAGRAVAVETEDAVVHRARTVIANVNPSLLFGRLMDAADVPPAFGERLRNYRNGSGTFRMNVALAELPQFTCLPQIGEHHRSGIIIAPSLDYMDRAYQDAKRSGWSSEPVVEMLIPSTVDDTLAPAGAHVASLFCQQFAPQLPDGRSWDAVREAVADQIIATVDRYAPNFKRAVLGHQILSPLDLERSFGLIGGDIMHGHMSLDQLWAARPTLGYGSYGTPIPGLYLCGAGTHPGGGVSGLPGRNAARAVLRTR